MKTSHHGDIQYNIHEYRLCRIKYPPNQVFVEHFDNGLFTFYAIYIYILLVLLLLVLLIDIARSSGSA